MIPYHENAVLKFKDSSLLQFINCKLLRNHKFVDEHLWVENGRVINPEPVFFDSKRPADAIIDCKGAILAPGFIDIQINGKKFFNFWKVGQGLLLVFDFFELFGSGFRLIQVLGSCLGRIFSISGKHVENFRVFSNGRNCIHGSTRRETYMKTSHC